MENVSGGLFAGSPASVLHLCHHTEAAKASFWIISAGSAQISSSESWRLAEAEI